MRRRVNSALLLVALFAALMLAGTVAQAGRWTCIATAPAGYKPDMPEDSKPALKNRVQVSVDYHKGMPVLVACHYIVKDPDREP